MMLKFSKAGISLVELMVSVSLFGLMAMGIGFFLSNGLPNMLRMEQRQILAQQKFVATAVLQKKLENIITLLTDFSLSPNGTEEVIALNAEEFFLPFFYMGKAQDTEGKERLVFKNFLAFNKVTEVTMRGRQTQVYGNSGKGKIQVFGGRMDIVNRLPANFAGFTKMGNDWFVAVPHENRVLVCPDSRANCSLPGNPYRFLSLTLNGTSTPYVLSSPMDVATDGTSLFVSDGGSGKILKIENISNDAGMVTPLAEGLNFPTGLAYDSNGNVLFFAETLNHVVKKIDLGQPGLAPTPVTSPIEGEAACAESARSCRLNFPTGLFVEPVSRHLYIADSGNNRVLRVSDLGKPTEVTLRFKTNDSSEAIKKVEVRFPAGIVTTPTTALALSSDPDNVSPNGSLSIGNRSLAYELFTQLSEGSTLTNSCEEEPCGPPNKIRVLEPPLIFNNPPGLYQEIRVGDDPNNPFLHTGRERGAITLNRELLAEHATGTKVALATPVAPNTEVTFTITGVDTTGLNESYSTVTIEAYGMEDELLFSREHGLRVGDGILGTEDDLIQIIAANSGAGTLNPDGPYVLELPPTETEQRLTTSLLFPTGVSNAFIANTGRGKIITRRRAAEAGLNAYDGSALAPFDRMSDFELVDQDGIDGLRFTLNPNNLLELTVKAKVTEETVETYNLNAHVESAP